MACCHRGCVLRMRLVQVAILLLISPAFLFTTVTTSTVQAGAESCAGNNAGDENVVVAAQAIPTGGSIQSHNGKYKLVVQYDCNLVLFEMTRNWMPLWASNTSGQGTNCVAVMQLDGNFVLYDGLDIVLFETNTSSSSCSLLGGSSSFLAILQDDGNFVVYCEPKGCAAPQQLTPLWATGTDGW